MRHMTFKESLLWSNIGELVVISHKITLSVYKSAYFYDNCCDSPQTPVFLR